MTSPFDPRSWLPTPFGRSEPDRSWLDTWMDMTTWWVAPVSAATEAMRPEQLLAQLIDGIATRFSGQRLVLSVGGRRVPVLLDSLRLFRRDERFEVRVDLRDVELHGVRFDEISAVARSVSVSPGTQTTIVARRIETDGVASLADLVRWLDARTDAWSLSLDRRGEVRARHVERAVSFLVEPSVREGVAFLELREARWAGIRLPVPRWLRLERQVDVALDGDWTLIEARRTGDRVHFRLERDELVHAVQPGRLREAVMRGEMLEL